MLVFGVIRLPLKVQLHKCDLIGQTYGRRGRLEGGGFLPLLLYLGKGVVAGRGGQGESWFE